MEFETVFTVASLLVLLVITLLALISRKTEQSTISSSRKCEMTVTNALKTLDEKSYVIFENLILPSGGNTSHTEIDHVVVSPYGIFCIETKSHKGSIYGSRTNSTWRQYLGKNRYDVINPYRQNFKHVKALEQLLGQNIRVPIHSYVVFPNAKSVKIDGKKADLSIEAMMRNITRHSRQMYDLHDCERILKSLAYASSKRDALRDLHINEVRKFLQDKAA